VDLAQAQCRRRRGQQTFDRPQFHDGHNVRLQFLAVWIMWRLYCKSFFMLAHLWQTVCLVYRRQWNQWLTNRHLSSHVNQPSRRYTPVWTMAFVFFILSCHSSQRSCGSAWSVVQRTTPLRSWCLRSPYSLVAIIDQSSIILIRYNNRMKTSCLLMQKRSSISRSQRWRLVDL
jgi:hypothetical protein